MKRKTKIVCTIGPASESPEMVRKLIDTGMNIARLNFSHGTNEEHLERIRTIRKAAKEAGKVVGILLDIQGPKIRLGQVRPERVLIESGNEIVLTTTPGIGNEQRVFVGYPDLPQDVRPGDVVYIDDGLLELKVKEVNGNDVRCHVVVGGALSSRKGVTLPGKDVNLPAITEDDTKHICFGVEHGVDFIAASFVRRAAHINEVKRIISDAGGSIPVVAKIESDEGLRNIEEIIAVTDGVMVARGDLGVEIPPEEVPLAQKMIIKKCNERGVPVITATQMLDSMVRNPRATRAEITDVANAIFDGTDCVMLSGETAVGKYPVQAVEMMVRIATRMEEVFEYERMFEVQRKNPRLNVTDAVCLSTVQTAHDLGVKAILCSTQSGVTAKAIAKYRPQASIVALCPNEEVVRQLSIAWGVNPVFAERPDNIEDLIDMAIYAAKALDMVSSGDTVTITAGVKTATTGSTNILQVHEVK